LRLVLTGLKTLLLLSLLSGCGRSSLSTPECDGGCGPEAPAPDLAVTGCQDGQRDGQESDIDCGGPTCAACGNGSRCGQASDCQSRSCEGGLCQPTSCTDGIVDGSESDVDCGGGTCPGCPDGARCRVGADCRDGVCDPQTGLCADPSCTDGVKNGPETDVDCGGPCVACDDGRRCVLSRDCKSAVCQAGVCQAATCTDHARNGQETDVDCGGGVCPACGLGLACLVDHDCSTADCWKGRCSLPPVPRRALPPLGPLGGGTDVAVLGDDFQPGATVTFAAASLDNVAFFSPSRITGTTPAAMVPGRVRVTVQNPDGQQGSAEIFAYQPPPPPLPQSTALGLDRQLLGALVTDDFDGDGQADLAVTDQMANAVLLLIGRGDGTFAAPVTLKLGGQGPDALVAADLNGDGKRDLAVVNYNTADASILLGAGGGAFAPSVEYPTGGGSASAVAAADLDGDGTLDLAVADFSGSQVTFLRGDGVGGFKAGATAMTGLNPQQIAVGDFNGDKVLDLVTSDATGRQLTQLLGKGDGTFPISTPIGTRSHNSGVAAADLDGDGVADIATIVDYVGVQLFQSQAGALTVTTPELPGALAIADLDGDGSLDLLTSNSPANLSVSLGNGHGGFAAAISYAGFAASSLAVADYNDDGVLDVAGAVGHDVVILLGAGLGALAMPVDAAVPYDANDRAVIADMDGDGFADVTCSDGPYLLFGHGDGSFESAQWLLVNGGPQLAVGDFTGDGVMDVVTGQAAARSLSLVAGQGNRAFAVKTPSATGYTGITALDQGDFDGDGKLDVAFVGGTGVWGPMLGHGDGTFAVVSAPFVQMVKGPSFIEAVDIDLDHHPDLLVAERDGSIQTALNTGKGGFGGARATTVCAAQAQAVALADLDGDGHLDAVVTCREKAVVVALGKGDGSWKVQAPVAVPDIPGPVALGDLDGDGRLDAAVALSGWGAAVLLGDGHGGLGAPTRYGPYRPTFDLGIADFTGDGKPDLMLHAEGTVVVLPNLYP